MARRGHELDAETADVPADGRQHVGVGFAGVASARADLSEFQRAAEQLFKLRIERGFGDLRSPLFAGDDQVAAVARRELETAGIRDGFPGAGVGAFGTEEALAEIDVSGIIRADRAGRAGLRADAASVRTFRGVNNGATAEAIRQRRRCAVRIRCCAMFLLKPREEDVHHKSCPQYERLKLLLQIGKSEIS